jgi:hypothetical protein
MLGFKKYRTSGFGLIYGVIPEIPGETEKKPEMSQHTLCPGRKSNQSPTEYKYEALQLGSTSFGPMLCGKHMPSKSFRRNSANLVKFGMVTRESLNVGGGSRSTIYVFSVFRMLLFIDCIWPLKQQLNIIVTILIKSSKYM